MRWNRFLVLVVLAGAVAALGIAGAAEKKEDRQVPVLTEKEKQSQQDIADLGTAMRLAELGDQQAAPEMLLTAAFLYRKFGKSQLGKLDVKPEIEAEKDDKVLDKEIKGPDYEAEAKKLVERAREIAAEKKVNIEPLIKDMEARKLDRAVVSGPKHVSRVIGPGQWQTYNIEVEPHKPFSFAFKANKALRVEIVRKDNNNIYGANILPFGSGVYSPGGPSKGHQFVAVSIRFKNEHKEPAEYTMLLQ